MNWINIRTETLRSPAFIDAKVGAMETWLKILAYCCEQENGGMIFDSGMWEDRKWLATCGVTKSDVQNAFPLVFFSEDNLHVSDYPLGKQKEVKKKRLSGKMGGTSKTQAKTQAARQNGTQGGRPSLTQAANPTERNGKEGEGNPNGNPNPNNSPPTPPENGAAPLKGVKEGKDSSMIPTTPQSRRVAAIFHRGELTPWASNEVDAYRKLGTVPEDDLAAVEAYYAANWPPKRDHNILRHNLITFLNNFPSEVDRAKAMKAKPKQNRSLEWAASKVIPIPTETRVDIEQVRLLRERINQMPEENVG